MKSSDLSRDLKVIEEMVRPLNAPVMLFENRIRTSPLRTLISVLLSSRTKDQVTLGASERLFEGISNPQDLAELTTDEIERRIYPVGFFRQKARHIKDIADFLKKGNALMADRDQLMTLPGVGRKTANLVLALAFGVPAITVDIHVYRISRRLGWSQGVTPLQVEEELMSRFDRNSEWIRLNQALVAFGQTICRPVGPKCPLCQLKDRCPFALGSRSRVSEDIG